MKSKNSKTRPEESFVTFRGIFTKGKGSKQSWIDFDFESTATSRKATVGYFWPPMKEPDDMLVSWRYKSKKTSAAKVCIEFGTAKSLTAAIQVINKFIVTSSKNSRKKKMSASSKQSIDQLMKILAASGFDKAVSDAKKTGVGTCYFPVVTPVQNGAIEVTLRVTELLS